MLIFSPGLSVFFVRALGGVLPLGLTRGFGASHALRDIAIPFVSHYSFETLLAGFPPAFARAFGALFAPSVHFLTYCPASPERALQDHHCDPSASERRSASMSERR